MKRSKQSIKNNIKTWRWRENKHQIDAKETKALALIKRI